MTTMRVVGECFFWYRLTRVFPDKFHRAVKRLCVFVLYVDRSDSIFLTTSQEIGWEEHVQNYLFCVEWHVKR